MASPIPEVWRKDVVRILRTCSDRRISWTPQAFQRWKTDSNGGWRNEAYEAMIAALSNAGIEGDETTSEKGQAATYQFLFWRGTTLMYGKIALLKNRIQILILSAHRAERDTL
jgi:hypothetical protein